MVDIAGDKSTTSVVTVGSTTNGTIDFGSDHDWFQVTLTAGEKFQVTMNGIGPFALEDPYIRIRDSAGNVIFENDDGGAGRNAFIAFQASYTGVYYIDLAAWDEVPAQYNYTGDYELKVENFQQPPVATLDQIAFQLTNGYWTEGSHHFPVSQGGSISVNLVGLTGAGQTLAREALRVWSDTIGVSFVEVGQGGQIIFDDNEDGASASAVWSQGITSSARINISTRWLVENGTTVGSYSFQTYLHEIGHALGLGHAGNYNMEASFPFDALFLNDAWSTSIMSYFSPTESSYFIDRGFTESYVGTPMLADMVAASQLYGLSTTTRLGNTTYGFNSNAGNDIYNANLHPAIAYTVFDSGGVDTLDFSGFSQNQLIDLTSGEYSNVGGRTGTISIAIGTLIENATGGSGDDTIRGNHGNNLLIGNGGNDRIFGFDGDDTFISGAGDDYFAGGNGIDTVSYANAAAGIFIDRELAGSVNNVAGIGNDGLVEIEVIIGTAFNDSFLGTNLGQRFEGGAGDDILNGQGGADILVGGPGADIFRSTRDGLNGDIIVDFGTDDRLVIADASFGTFTYSLSGTTLAYSGGSLTFGAAITTGLTARAVAGGVGVELTINRPLFANPVLKLGDFGAAPGAGGWSSDDRYPRLLADMNGDGQADIVGFGENGAYVALATGGGSFATPALVTTAFGASAGAGGWPSNDRHLRLLADVNGDGRADIVGFGNDGVYVSLSAANGSFGATTLATTAFGAAAHAGGWSSNDLYLRELADVNGDGKVDIVGFGRDGVYVSLGTGNTFAAPTLATTAFGAGGHAGGWSSNDLYLRQLADVNGDGRADIVGFGNSGVYVALAGANGSFAAPTLSLGEYGVAASAGGWTSDDRFPRELADVNGDRKVDIVGFGNGGVYIAYGKGDGTFEASKPDLNAFGAQPGAGGWTSDDLYPRHLADVNNDGAADIVGFAGGGVYVSLSTIDLLS